MLIYFGEAAFMTLIERFARAVVPRGYLMLGHSESLIDRSPSFRAVVLNGMVVYQRCAVDR
jgi:chemotaxis methyl-accepting protein methylase